MVNKVAGKSGLVALLLAVVGGFLDAYSYIEKGGVFANAQTGNLVLMAMGLSAGDVVASLKFLIPIVTFALGILAANMLKNSQALSDTAKQQSALVLEGVLLLSLGLCGKAISDYAANCILSFIAAIQVATFDKYEGNAIATTMITGNLKSGMAAFSKFLVSKKQDDAMVIGKYFQVIACFALGVAAGCWSIQALREYAILLCLAPLVVVSVCLGTNKRPTFSA